MDLEQIVADTSSRNEKIMGKYNTIMKQISDLQQDILNIPNKYSDRSPQFQSDKKISLERKLNKLQEKVEEWLKKQQESILERETNQIQKVNEARKGFEQIKTTKNEYSEIKGYNKA